MKIDSIVQVAVGVVSDKNNRFLVSQRSKNSHLKDLWEFPGGKIEAGESSYQALCRELKEEVGIQVKSADALTTISHDYGNLMVNLQAWRVQEYCGKAYGAEDQLIMWVTFKELMKLNVPAANVKLIQYLNN